MRGWMWGLCGLLACSGDGATDDPSVTDEATDVGTGTGTGGDTGTSSTLPSLFQSGTRLQAAYRDGGPGARLFTAWQDTELGMDCFVRQIEPGRWACLPTYLASIVYLDEACTQPAFQWESCGSKAPGAYVMSGSGDSCAPGSSDLAYEVGASVVQDHVYAAGSCDRLDFFEDRTFYRATARPTSDFVSFTAEHLPVGDGLGVRNLVGADGSSQITAMINTEHDQVCRSQTLGKDYAPYCLHGDAAYHFGTRHSDAGCTQGDVAHSFGTGTCDPPAYALTYETEPTCNYRYAVLHELGESLDPSSVYSGSPGACFPAPDTQSYWAVGDPAGDVLPALTERYLGDGRLQLATWTTASGDPLTPAAFRWYDTSLGIVCGVYDTKSHGARCLPSVFQAHAGFGEFADAACTERVMRWPSDPCLAQEPPTLAALYEADGCTSWPLYDLREIGALHEGTVYYSGGTKSCKPIERKGDVFYRFGKSVSAAVYAPLPEVRAR